MALMLQPIAKGAPEMDDRSDSGFEDGSSKAPSAPGADKTEAPSYSFKSFFNSAGFPFFGVALVFLIIGFSQTLYLILGFNFLVLSFIFWEEDRKKEQKRREESEATPPAAPDGSPSP